MYIQERIDEISLKDKSHWNYKKVYSNGIHKIAKYPATMVPDMQSDLLSIILKGDKKFRTILDPFHGSGTSLVESAKYDIFKIGIDINPLAHLMTRVKLEGVNHSKIKLSISKLVGNIDKLRDCNLKLHNFDRIEKWFRDDIIKDLTILKYAIEKEERLYVQRYFWVCLSDLILKYSNTRTTTFKLHVKRQEDIYNMKNNIISDFIKKVNTEYEMLPEYNRKKNHRLFLGDSINVMKKFNDNEVDLVITSPPYGDNGTTVTYGQFSMLPIKWMNIDKLCLKFDEKLIDNYSSIDSLSLGGKSSMKKTVDELKTIKILQEKISKDKMKKINSFVYDYQQVISEIARVTSSNGYIVMVLGNRRVDNQVVPLSDITTELFEKYSCRVCSVITRDIPHKRMPSKVSKVKNKSVKSMSEEKIIIYQKGKYKNE